MEKQRGRYFPNNLKYFRRLFNLSQKEVAWILQIHVTRLSKFERGVAKPDLDMLNALAALYQTTTQELYFESYAQTRHWVHKRKTLFLNLKYEETIEETCA